jgi:hypothetical protein
LRSKIRRGATRAKQRSSEAAKAAKAAKQRTGEASSEAATQQSKNGQGALSHPAAVDYSYWRLAGALVAAIRGIPTPLVTKEPQNLSRR